MATKKELRSFTVALLVVLNLPLALEASPLKEWVWALLPLSFLLVGSLAVVAWVYGEKPRKLVPPVLHYGVGVLMLTLLFALGLGNMQPLLAH